jgi:hypothetical protein
VSLEGQNRIPVADPPMPQCLLSLTGEGPIDEDPERYVCKEGTRMADQHQWPDVT